MSKPNKPQQKPAQPIQRPQPATPTSTTTRTAPARPSRTSLIGSQNDTLVFGRENYKWMLIGIGIMAVGYILMSGGSMPADVVWKEKMSDNPIYSPLRIIVAPFLILLGLGVEVYAIFKKNPTQS